MMNVRTVRSLLILTGFSLALNLAGNASMPLFDRDEPRFAQAAREMMESGNLIVPTFNGAPRYDKPIVIYWLMDLAYLAFGVNEFAARLPSALCGTMAVLMTALWGIRILGPRTGPAAGWILASAMLVLVESKIATADGALLLAMVLTLRCLFEVVQRTDSPLHRYGFWVALGVATLTKGPVALGVVGTTMLCYGLLTRDWKVFSGLRFGRGVLIFLAVVLPWTVAAAVMTDGEFLEVALGHHVLNRSVNPLEGHDGFFGFHTLLLLATFLPWGFLLPGVLAESVREAREDTVRVFLLSNLIGPLILFELVQTKLAHYMLPSFPALALLVGIYFTEGDRGFRSRTDWAPRVALGLAVAAFAALVVFLPEALREGGLEAYTDPIFRPIGAFILVAAVGYALLAANRIRAGFAMLVASPALFLPILLVNLTPILEELQFAPRLARETRALTGAGGKPVVWDDHEPTMVFYYNGIPIYEEIEALRRYLGEAAHPVVLSEYEEAGEELAALELVPRGQVSGYNFAKGEPVTWLILTPPGGAAEGEDP